MSKRNYATMAEVEWALMQSGIGGIDSEVSLSEAPTGGWTIKSSGSLAALDNLAVYDASTDAATRLQNAKVTAKRRVIAFADSLTNKIFAAYPKAEVASWPEQASQARRVAAGETLVPGELLINMADKAGVSVADYAAAVLVKSASFAAITVEVKALRDQAGIAVDALTDATDIEPLLVNLKSQAETVADTLGL